MPELAKRVTIDPGERKLSVEDGSDFSIGWSYGTIGRGAQRYHLPAELPPENRQESAPKRLVASTLDRLDALRVRIIQAVLRSLGVHLY